MIQRCIWKQELEIRLKVYYEDKWVHRNARDQGPAGIILACLLSSSVIHPDSIRPTCLICEMWGCTRSGMTSEFQCKCQPKRMVGRIARSYTGLWEVVMRLFTDVLHGHSVREDPSFVKWPFLGQELPMLPSILFSQDHLESGPVWDWTFRTLGIAGEVFFPA